MKTKENSGKKLLIIGIMLLMAFVVWTYLIQTVDVQPVGQNGTVVGFAELNCKFHVLTGVHMKLYTITDRLGLVPVFVCIIFGVIGLIQLIKRKSYYMFRELPFQNGSREFPIVKDTTPNITNSRLNNIP